MPAAASVSSLPMPSLALLAPGRTGTASAVLIATRAVGSSAEPVAGAEVADDLLGGRLAAALQALRARGQAEEVVRIPVLATNGVDLVVAVGLGEQAGDTLDPEAVRRAVGAGVRSLAGIDTVLVALGPVGDPVLIAAVAEGAALGGYTFDRYKTGAVTPPIRRVQVRGPANAATRAAVRRAEVIGAAVATVRDQVNTPPADLYPGAFADQVAALGTDAGCAVEVLDEKALRAGGYGGILGVGAGAAHPPRLVRITHRPARPRARIALVGKGITFDSGGYNLKVPLSGSMKHDMAGAATMLAAVVAAARLKLPVEVTATAPMAQNMVSSTGYLPSDILTIRGGRTVEIDNTDAEGRLVLADGIVRATEDEPDFLIETSTLTGAALIALGQRTAGVMGEETLRTEIVTAGAEAGESLWPMPLLPDLRPGLDSPVADLRNVTGERYGGMLVGGLFLAEFIPAGLKWAHIDQAGPAWNGGSPYGYTPKGGTGFGLRTILRLMERIGARTG